MESQDETKRYKRRRGERRKGWRLSEDEFEAISVRAAERGLERIYSEVGKGVLRRVLWLLGTAAVAAAGYFGYRGTI